MSALTTPTILLGFLLSWSWGIPSQLLQPSAAAAPYLDEGYLLRAAPPDLERGVAPLGPPAPTQPPLLGRLCITKTGLPRRIHSRSAKIVVDLQTQK